MSELYWEFSEEPPTAELGRWLQKELYKALRFAVAEAGYIEISFSETDNRDPLIRCWVLGAEYKDLVYEDYLADALIGEIEYLDEDRPLEKEKRIKLVNLRSVLAAVIDKIDIALAGESDRDRADATSAI
jgi:hypothetical protein